MYATTRCLSSRRGHDWTDRFPTTAAALRELAVKSAIFDGEIVMQKPDGTTDFQALQNVMKRGSDASIVYYVFDLLYYRGHDLRQVHLIERKKLLSQLIAQGEHTRSIRYSDHITGEGPQVFTTACRKGLEGIVAKHRQPLRRTTDLRLGESQMSQTPGICDRRLEPTQAEGASLWGHCW